MFQWLENLGYDSNFIPTRSKNFMLCIHSNHEVEVSMEDTLQTDIEERTNLLLINKFGHTYTKTEDYVVKYSFSDKVMCYSYAVTNTST